MQASELVMRARSGDDRAAGELMNECICKVKQAAWSFSQSSGISQEDLLQEVGMKLVVKWALILDARDPLAYSLRVARNAMIDQYRVVARQRKHMKVVSLEKPLGYDSDWSLLDVLEA
jgi:DNA-directed RNA polymerase specialized sigma24 family protein